MAAQTKGYFKDLKELMDKVMDCNTALEITKN